MSTLKWLEHFRTSCSRERNFDFDGGVRLAPSVRTPLLRSIQTFQRGLSSPGNDLRTKIRRSCDSDYAAAIDLYVKEKQVHADLLAQLLWASDSKPTGRAISDFAFRRLRRRFNWAPELMILLTAEMASMHFFRVVAGSVDDAIVRGVMESIVSDQAYHLGFHIDHLRPEMEKRSGAQRVGLQHAWSAFFAATLALVIADNRAAFAALDYSRLSYWTDANNLFAQVQSGLHGSQSHAAILSRDPRIRFVI